ncbi:hypothetical protein OB919_16585 [Halobacteria archaeon AArc-curdl1]|uniref:Uncharacterized protein n=1 Tax=Natronosalvus hydrolyticus TaxID=2979988 RepID=A0AAP3E857_9EURY|nr:hypothetical protein [Halobacteria archaeon AArc-curdl1]
MADGRRSQEERQFPTQRRDNPLDPGHPLEAYKPFRRSLLTAGEIERTLPEIEPTVERARDQPSRFETLERPTMT